MTLSGKFEFNKTYCKVEEVYMGSQGPGNGGDGAGPPRECK